MPDTVVSLEEVALSMRVRDLLGKEVMGSEGHRVGKIANVNVDPSMWQVTEFEVELEKHVAKAYNVKRTFGKTIVPLSVDEISSVGDAVILKGPKMSFAGRDDEKKKEGMTYSSSSNNPPT